MFDIPYTIFSKKVKVENNILLERTKEAESGLLLIL
jgi:hypothetical protein